MTRKLTKIAVPHLIVCLASLLSAGCGPEDAALTQEQGDVEGEALGTVESALLNQWISGNEVPGDWGAPDSITMNMDTVGTWPGGEGLTGGTHTIIRRDNDVVFVRDNAKDGKSAVTRVILHYCIRNGNVDTSNTGAKRTCRNKHGVGTWARCDFDWPENCVYQVRVGTYDGDTGKLNLDVNTSLLGFED